MIEPPPIISRPGARNPLGWIVLGFIILLLIGLNLQVYFTRSTNFKAVYESAENSVTLAIGGSTPNRSQLENQISKLKPFEKTEPEARLANLVLEHEVGQPVDQNAVKLLHNSRSARDQAYFQIYGAGRLDKEQAEKLQQQVGEKTSFDRLAGIHALEKAKLPAPRNFDKAIFAQLGAGLIYVLIFFGGMAAIVLYIALRAGGYFKPRGLLHPSLQPADADRLALRDSHMFALFVIVPFLIRPLAPYSELMRPLMEIATYLLLTLAILTLTKIPVEGRVFSLSFLGIRREQDMSIGKQIAFGGVAALANIPIIILVSVASNFLFRGLPTPEHPTTIEIMDGSPLVVVASFLAAVVFAPLIEEIMFRGTMFPALSSVLKSPVAGALLSSFLFAAIHPTGIPAWPALMCIALMSCFLVTQTKSLIPSIAMHAFHNAFTLLNVLLLFRR